MDRSRFSARLRWSSYCLLVELQTERFAGPIRSPTFSQCQVVNVHYYNVIFLPKISFPWLNNDCPHKLWQSLYSELNLVDAQVASSPASPIFFNARNRKIREAQGDEANAYIQVLTLKAAWHPQVEHESQIHVIDGCVCKSRHSSHSKILMTWWYWVEVCWLPD